MIRRMLFGAVFLVALVAAPASAQYNPIVITPDVGCQGSVMSVSGQGYAPGEEVTLTLLAGDQTGSLPSPPGGVVLGTAIVDGSGNFTQPFTVPGGTGVGVKTVVAAGGQQVLAATITVNKCTPPTTPPGTPPDGGVGGIDDGRGFGDGGTGSGNLAGTGSDLNGVGLFGVGLLAAGGLVLLATRRRHGHGQAGTTSAA